MFNQRVKTKGHQKGFKGVPKAWVVELCDLLAFDILIIPPRVHEFENSFRTLAATIRDHYGHDSYCEFTKLQSVHEFENLRIPHCFSKSCGESQRKRKGMTSA